MSSACGFSLFMILLPLLVAHVINHSEASGSVAQVNGSATSTEMVPVKVVEMRLMLNESRRRLNGFQICGLCTCCGGSKGVCLASPCCYAINCNIPNRPFGFCSFTPKSCNCFGCHL